MPKVIISSDSNNDSTLRINSDSIIMWFDALFLSTKSDCLNQWLDTEPLLSQSDDSVAIITQGDYYYHLPISQIIRIENVSNESSLFLDNEIFIKSSIPLDIFADELKNYHFFHIHPNHLINVMFLKKLVHCNAFVTLTNSEAIPVSIAKEELLLGFLKKRAIL